VRHQPGVALRPLQRLHGGIRGPGPVSSAATISPFSATGLLSDDTKSPSAITTPVIESPRTRSIDSVRHPTSRRDSQNVSSASSTPSRGTSAAICPTSSTYTSSPPGQGTGLAYSLSGGLPVFSVGEPKRGSLHAVSPLMHLAQRRTPDPWLCAFQGRVTLAWLPADDHLAQSPRVPLLEFVRVGPPVRAPHVHRPIGTHERLSATADERPWRRLVTREQLCTCIRGTPGSRNFADPPPVAAPDSRTREVI
jgi:hypothetical protein